MSPAAPHRAAPPAQRRVTLGALLALAAGSLVAVPAAASAAPEPAPAPAAVADPAGLVNPFIGTQNDGNTFPGASMPFGMVQLSPDTGHYVGYDWNREEIRGFSIVHPSGVGCGLGGDLPIMPTVGEITSTDYTRYASAYSHDDEEAEPGYYRVGLEKYDVTAELTATTRTGTHRYTFPSTGQANVLLNTGQALHQVLSSDVRVVDDRTIEATIVGQGFCQDTEPYTLYTVTTFDRPFDEVGTWAGDTVTADSEATAGAGRRGAYARFDTTDGDLDVEATTALSWVDLEGARANLAAEGTGTFDETREAAHDTWNERLSQVGITGGTEEQQRTFYSSMYRALLSPNTGSDVDGRYTGWDQEIHTLDDDMGTYYQTWSLWDTYRTQQQLLSLLAPAESRDMALSLLKVEDQGGWLPRWGYGTVETNIMTGDPATPFLVSAFQQGLLEGHEEEAYAAITENADGVPPADSQYSGRAGNEFYLANGYVPHEPSTPKKPGDFDLHHGGSATLEYALADATLATMAQDLGHAEDAARYAARGQNYRSLFNPDTGFFQARDADGVFVGDPDPASSPGFHEGTAWQYLWLVQQDIPGLIDLIGGREETNERLDSFFAYDELLTNREQTVREVWINGPYDYYNADKYNPQNEPNIHAPYTYLWTGQPWKTTDVVHAALTLFTDAPNGVTGNDDMGTMSSWHVLSALGIYPAVPGTETWALTSPVFERVEIALDDEYYPGGDLLITAPGTSDASRYIQGVTLSGEPLDRSYITGDDIRAGAEIAFEVGAAPSDWATQEGAAPAPINSADYVLEHLGAGVTPERTILYADAEEATRVDLSVPVVATGAGTIRGTVTVTTEGPLTTADSTLEWSVRSGNLPAPIELAVPVDVAVGAAPGEYAVTITVTDTRGNEVTREASIIVAEPGGLVPYFTNVGIGDDGADNADFDGMGWYYSRTALAGAGVLQGQTYPLGETGMSFALPLVPAGEPDNIVAQGQTIDVEDLLRGATQFSLIGSGTNGDQRGTAVLGLSDGTTLDTPVTLTDWCSGNPADGNTFVARTGYRGHNAGTDGVRCSLFATTPIVIPDGAAITSITLPNSPNMHVFAIAHDAPEAPDELIGTGGVLPGTTVGTPFSGPVALFTGGTGESAEDYTATVDWGDGSEATPGTITTEDGVYVVNGEHTFAAAGEFTVLVEVTDAAGESITIGSTITVAPGEDPTDPPTDPTDPPTDPTDPPTDPTDPPTDPTDPPTDEPTEAPTTDEPTEGPTTEAPPAGDGGDEGPGAGDLPATGMTPTAALLAAFALALGAGALAIRRRQTA